MWFGANLYNIFRRNEFNTIPGGIGTVHCGGNTPIPVSIYQPGKNAKNSRHIIPPSGTGILPDLYSDYYFLIKSKNRVKKFKKLTLKYLDYQNSFPNFNRALGETLTSFLTISLVFITSKSVSWNASAMESSSSSERLKRYSLVLRYFLKESATSS